MPISGGRAILCFVELGWQMFPVSAKIFNSSLSSTERIFIRLDGRGNRIYYPGETLAGSYFLNEIRRDSIDTIECSVLWHTEGKGNEDVGAHAFWRLSSQNGDWIDPLQPGRFSVVLPESPLTYNGNIVKIRWSVRLRVFLSNGAQLMEETPFYLGDLPDMRTLKLFAG
ncbi:MAG: hypothetical protein ACOX0A_02405 [Thermoguttaceae bacterium]